MSQEGELGNRRSGGRFVSFDDPVSTQAGNSSYGPAPVALSNSVQAARSQPTQGPPIPTITVTPVLDPYRPVSRDHRGPDSLLQAAWAAAPKPKSFLEAIAQSTYIRENTYRTPNANLGPLADPVTMPPATAILPARPADIITPPQQSAYPVYGSTTNTATGIVTQSLGPTVPYQSPSDTSSSGHVAQSFGSTVPSESYSGAVSTRPPAPRFPPGLYLPTSTGAVHGPVEQRQRLPGTLLSCPLPRIQEESDMIAQNSIGHPSLGPISHVDQPYESNVFCNGSHSIASPRALPAVYSNFEGRSYSSPFASDDAILLAGPASPSESSSSTISPGRSSPHLGSNLFAPALRATPGSLYDDQFVPPTLHTPPVVSSGRSASPHLGTGLSAPMDAEIASSLRLAAVLQSTARPCQQPSTFHEPGYYGLESEPSNQPLGFGAQSFHQVTYGPSYQAPPFDPRAIYGDPSQAALQPLHQSAYQAPPYDPLATYGAPNQAASQTIYQDGYEAPPYYPRATYEPLAQLATQLTLHPRNHDFSYQASYEATSQSQDRYSGWDRHYGRLPSIYEEQTLYELQPLHLQPMQLQPMQSGQQNRPNTGPPQYENARLLSPAPELPSALSASADSSRSISKPPLERETLATEFESREAAVANLERAKQAVSLAELRVGIRQKQLKNIDKKLQSEKESELIEEGRYQQDDERAWRQVERRDAKRANRR
jgi:hypothetical protein